MKKLFAIFAATLIGTSATAEMYEAGDLMIADPFVFATPQTARAGGGFMTVTNNGDAADTLLEVRADYPRIEIHTTEMEGDVAKMVHIGTLDIPAGEAVTLQPGGLHVMFMGLSEPFVEGEPVSATLVFEKAGEVNIVFDVRKRGEHGGMGHGSMDHGNMSHGEGHGQMNSETDG